MRNHSDVVINHAFGDVRQIAAMMNAGAGDTAYARLEIVRNECHAKLAAISADIASAEAQHVTPAPAAPDRLQMLAGMDPDLRTPLHAVLGYAQMLHLGGNLTNQQAQWVGVILSAGKRLLEQVHNAVGLADAAPHQGAWHIDDGGEASAQPVASGIVAAACAAVASAPSAGAPRVLRVLVVDDIAMNCEIASEFIRAAGHHASTADSGAQAVAAAGAKDFDVVLMDIRMPEMDGFEATRQIRALEGRRGRVPIVALSAMAFQRDVEDCRAAGMSGHLAKPFRYETLNEAVRLAAAGHEPLELKPAGPARAPPLRFAPESDARLAPSWIDIDSPWTGMPISVPPENDLNGGQCILDTQFKLKLVAIGNERSRHLVDKNRTCAPPPERPQHEFHWLLYTDEAGTRTESFRAQCDLWRWSNAAWRNISVPGAKFSPDEMYEQGWRYCGPCVEKTALVEVE